MLSEYPIIHHDIQFVLRFCRLDLPYQKKKIVIILYHQLFIIKCLSLSLRDLAYNERGIIITREIDTRLVDKQRK